MAPSTPSACSSRRCSTTLGWSRTGLSGAFSLYAFVYTALALVAGRLTDRWGPRAVIAVGGAFLGVGWVAMGGVREPGIRTRSTGSWPPSACRPRSCRAAPPWRAGSCGDVGSPSASPSAAWRLGTLVLPPVAHVLTTRVGWRWAYVIFGVAIFIGLNLVATVMRRDPESAGLDPDGDAAPARSWRRRENPDAWTLGQRAPHASVLDDARPLRRDLGPRSSGRSCTWSRWHGGSALRPSWPPRS